ncbi:MAG: hypothetical protein NVSMB62_09270 [Acidobacteriaceae bacterium]
MAIFFMEYAFGPLGVTRKPGTNLDAQELWTVKVALEANVDLANGFNTGGQAKQRGWDQRL